MSVSEQQNVKELEVRVALHESDLLSLLPEDEHRLRRRLENFLLAGSKKATDLVAHFSASKDTFTLTGLLRGKWPVYLVVNPSSRTYANFIRLLAEELRSLSTPAETQPTLGRAALLTLSQHLEEKLESLPSAFNVAPAQEIVDVFKGDFKVLRKLGRCAPKGRRLVVGRYRVPNKRKVRFLDDGAPKLISGFLILEIEGVEAREDASALLPTGQTWTLRDAIRFPSRPSVRVEGASAVVAQEFEIDPALRAKVDLYLHWGSYDGTPWIDQEVPASEIAELRPGFYRLSSVVQPSRAGMYGVTVAAKSAVSDERVWVGETHPGDEVFDLTVEAFSVTREFERAQVRRDVEIRGRILHALSSFDLFVRVMRQLMRDKDVRGLGRVLYELTAENAFLRRLVSEYFQQALDEISRKGRGVRQAQLRKLIPLLRNIGVGEVVLVSPEGPHAIAGGLAQVTVGLTDALAECQIGATLITPLYEEAQGNKHRSAEVLLAEGVKINGKLVPIRPAGAINIPFGPIRHWNSATVTRSPFIARAEVYLAEGDGVRIFFLRHRRLADKLYANVWSDEELRRAIFLSRGALELMKDRRFNIAPHIIVSNDWMTGLVPVLLQTDPRYIFDEVLKKAETVHAIHNGGRDYQGRFATNFFGEDLFPLLGISAEHFFGLSDPLEPTQLNFTAGAIFHVRKAILTVSKPYAEQLLTPEGGEGLHTVFRRRRNMIFGISNGIDLESLRRLFWELGERAREALNLPMLGNGKYHEKRLLRHLPLYKQGLKHIVQEKYGLVKQPHSVLISLISRLAEQKGIQLLTDRVRSGMTLLEEVLKNHPEVQLIIGGPCAEWDPVVVKLREVVTELKTRYPGRIAAVFDFILHKDALEITEASDLFLMPSRYEPGGITQLEALAAGTLVIARNVGGISATLRDYRELTEEGNSFLFEEYSSDTLLEKIIQGVQVMSDSKRRRHLMLEAAVSQHDWSHRATKYVALFQHVSGVLKPQASYPHLSGEFLTLESIRPR